MDIKIIGNNEVLVSRRLPVHEDGLTDDEWEAQLSDRLMHVEGIDEIARSEASEDDDETDVPSIRIEPLISPEKAENVEAEILAAIGSTVLNIHDNKRTKA